MDNEQRMPVLRTFIVVLTFIAGSILLPVQAGSFTLHSESSIAVEVKTDDPLIQWAANDVTRDLSRITGTTFSFSPQRDDATSPRLIIAVDPTLALFEPLENSPHGKWEAFVIYQQNGNLHITGADTRGAVFGLFTLAEKAGISPWQWWADVPIPSSNKTAVKFSELPIVDSPKVKFRGIFINDEDWGLLPWAANTFEPIVANIGPQTYEKVFQLLLRLKANTLWPAMHPGTRAFFAIKGNKAMAEKYHINIGSSHAEPMLRNNVDEWKASSMGDFNYVANTSNVERYWQERVQQVSSMPALAMFTLGMRGVHDSHMQGTGSAQENIAVLEQIIARQRSMLVETFDVPLPELRQVFTPYKEVLALYDAGLQVPDDVTLVWPDDNYGYIRRLSNNAEQSRRGGSGVYYHLSYWGRPHDYLWLSSTHPALIQFEMARAYANGARQLWIANVGDIKPIEYNTEWFFKLAWHGPEHQFQQSHDFISYQIKRDFGPHLAGPVSKILLDYFHLAFERRPEFMGWSQTEPTTATQLTGFTVEKIHARLAQFQALLEAVSEYAGQISDAQTSAWFQLIEYPVKAAAAMNQKWLYRHLASVATDEAEQRTYLAKAINAHTTIQQLTRQYNELENGKWRYMMDAAPRRLPVFDKPALSDNTTVVATQQHRRSVLKPSDMKAPADFAWRALPELGYSRGALTLLPATQHRFTQQDAALQYQFVLEHPKDVILQIATLPTHANSFDHQIEVRLNSQVVTQIRLNTVGRSDTWKLGVLSNRITNKISLGQLAPGTHTVQLAVNQTGIVIDEVAVVEK
ncbi:glycosyl hydrolase 115 family protein [Alteromonas gilva]|uniref:Glycosyl hydrolase 115 family protein n=1 Tax=Alteromonas gilva TaxID=2987522 RepID=A0ABT5L5J7_9ALTE|nr:glycosyl hydrolase 115 family protein [Alteromonas gilva]MDC8832153.1 glycosyl hydrolase 115 family protein [Alteromonas gilva]